MKILIIQENGRHSENKIFRECFNLQGFPSDYKLPSMYVSKLYSLAGNAVSVPVVKLIANKIIELI